MRRVLLPLLGLVLGAGAASGDLVIVQKVEGSGLEGEMTVKFKEKKVRADLATPVSTIADAETGETLVLQHRAKTFHRITADQTKVLVDQMMKAQAEGGAPKLTPLEEKKEISGHQTQGFLWTVGKMKVRFWVAKNYPNADAIQQQLDQMQNSGLSAVTASLMPTPQQMPGVRLRTEMEVAGQKVNTTITSIKEEALDPSLFQPPSEYKELPLPVRGPGAD